MTNSSYFIASKFYSGIRNYLYYIIYLYIKFVNCLEQNYFYYEDKIIYIGTIHFIWLKTISSQFAIWIHKNMSAENRKKMKIYYMVKLTNNGNIKHGTNTFV